MTAERRDLTAAEAEAILPGGPKIHTFVQMPTGRAGADRSRQEVLAMLHNATAIFRSGPRDRTLGHGLAVLQIQDGYAEVTFIETGQPRDLLHLAIGTFAEYLAGQATAARRRRPQPHWKTLTSWPPTPRSRQAFGRQGERQPGQQLEQPPKRRWHGH